MFTPFYSTKTLDYISNMGQPSNSRVRPTASNRRRHLRVEEPEVSDFESEDIQEQPIGEEQPDVRPQDRSSLV